MIPRLVVGLGNPGTEYRDTRHNVGFMTIDEVARRMGIEFQMEKRWKSLVAKQGNTVLIKPQTFMNASGDAVLAVSQFFKLDQQQMLVVFDDVDLALGTVRMRPSGSAGGHNGMRSIISRTGSDAFPRLKLGIANAEGRPAGHKLSGHVLGRFTEEERPALLQMIQRAADAVMQSLRSGLEATMNAFNRSVPAN
ncbi:MAG: aminoacyl-tRNA hydrolase [Verrucomicrobiaceae bacterium]|nr:aminoacyl-tRNA hydrolase [Verrucomicrobiaceae bacterium]